MNKREASIYWQKIAGTFDRNQEIKRLRGLGITYGAIGWRFNGLSRQRIFQICLNPYIKPRTLSLWQRIKTLLRR